MVISCSNIDPTRVEIKNGALVEKSADKLTETLDKSLKEASKEKGKTASLDPDMQRSLDLYKEGYTPTTVASSEPKALATPSKGIEQSGNSLA